MSLIIIFQHSHIDGGRSLSAKICAGLVEPAQGCIFTGGLLSVHYYSGETGEAG